MKTVQIMMFLIAVSFCVSSHATERTVRFSDLSTDEIKQLFQGGSSTVIVEFRQGDRLPVKATVEGDLLEGQENNAALLTVKRTFYVKVKKNDFLMSLDGTHFKPFQKMITGSFGVGVSGQPANELQMTLKANLR